MPTYRPITWQPPIVQPIAPRQWYFGMSLEVIQTAYGPGLQVASVTPGSPASLVGLERGDTLLAANSVSLQNAISNEHGVQLLQSAVTLSGGPAPTTTVSTRIAPQLITPQPIGNVLLTVLDIRTGQLARLNVQPQRVGGPAAIPTSPAPTFTSPAPVASAAPARTF